jgi:hypothetical protein
MAKPPWSSLTAATCQHSSLGSEKKYDSAGTYPKVASVALNDLEARFFPPELPFDRKPDGWAYRPDVDQGGCVHLERWPGHVWPAEPEKRDGPRK